MTEWLSSEQQPAFHLVIVYRQELIQIAKSSSSNEHPSLVEFENYFVEHLEKDCPIQDEHYMATVLHPQFKRLEVFIKKTCDDTLMI